MSSRVNSAFSAFMLLCVAAFAAVGGWTALNLRGGLADDDELTDRQKATATVKECERTGPLSLSGFGYWWECRVTVAESKGDSYEQVFRGSQFVKDDVGADFPLANSGVGSQTWRRADVPSNTLATFGALGGAVAAVVAGAMAVRRGRG